MPTPSGRRSMMDAILDGDKVSMVIGNRHPSFDKPVKSMVDGSLHHDMATYERHLAQKGYEIVGNDSSLYKDKKGRDMREIKAEKEENSRSEN